MLQQEILDGLRLTRELKVHWKGTKGERKNERVDDLPPPKKDKHVAKRGGKGGGGKRRSPD